MLRVVMLFYTKLAKRNLFGPTASSSHDYELPIYALVRKYLVSRFSHERHKGGL